MKKLLSILLVALLLATILPVSQVQAATKTAAAYLTDGNKLLTQNKYQDALKAFDAAIKLNAKYTEAYVGRGRALTELNKYADAIKAFDKAISLNKKYAPAYYYKGVSLFDEYELDDAMKAFNLAITYNPKYAEAYTQKGAVFFAQEKYTDAIKAADTAIKYNPKLISAYICKARVLYIGQNKYADASKVLDLALKIEPNNVAANFHKTIVMNKLAKYKEALVFAEKLIKLEPKVSFGYYEKGIALYNLGKYTEAIAAFKLSDKYPPSSMNVAYYIGMSYHGLGKYKEAIGELLKAVKYDSDKAALLTGEIHEGVYSNEYLGMSVTLPEGWELQESDMISALISQVSDLDPALYSTEAMKDLMPLMISKYPLGAPVESNPNLIFLMENVSQYSGMKGSDYIAILRENIPLQYPQATVSDQMETVVFDGISFDTLNISSDINGVAFNQRYYSTVYRGFALTFALTYTNVAELPELESILKTIKF